MAKNKEEKKTKTKADKAKVNYKDLSLAELQKAEEDLRRELYDMRVKTKTSSLPDVSKMQKNKRNIARILTVRKQRTLTENLK